MVLNLKAYAASRRSVLSDDLSPVSLSLPRFPLQHARYPRAPSPHSPESFVDLELYAIEREYQQLGTRLR